jgi:MASE1
MHPSATPVWPPTGIALAAILILGYRVWPGIFLGAFLVNITTAGSIATSIGIATGNTLEGLVGAYLVRRFAHGPAAVWGPPWLDRPRDMLMFAVLAGLVSTTISATFGVTSLVLGDLASWADYGAIWVTWWLGDAAGDLIVAPPLLFWITHPRVRWGWRRWVEAVLVPALLVLLGQGVFGAAKGWWLHFPALLSAGVDGASGRHGGVPSFMRSLTMMSASSSRQRSWHRDYIAAVDRPATELPGDRRTLGPGGVCGPTSVDLSATHVGVCRRAPAHQGRGRMLEADGLGGACRSPFRGINATRRIR